MSELPPSYQEACQRSAIRDGIQCTTTTTTDMAKNNQNTNRFKSRSSVDVRPFSRRPMAPDLNRGLFIQTRSVNNNNSTRRRDVELRDFRAQKSGCFIGVLLSLFGP